MKTLKVFTVQPNFPCGVGLAIVVAETAVQAEELACADAFLGGMGDAAKWTAQEEPRLCANVDTPQIIASELSFG